MTEELCVISAVRTPDDAGIATMVEDYAPLLYRVAYSLLRNPAEAEDTVQDTFVRVLQHRHALPAVRELRVWLTRITWNLALDRRRRIRPVQMDGVFAESLIAPQLPADDALGQRRQLIAALAAFDRLPHTERQALILTAIDELSIQEVAAVMEKSESAVRALLYRARTRLIQQLHKGGHR